MTAADPQQRTVSPLSAPCVCGHYLSMHNTEIQARPCTVHPGGVRCPCDSYRAKEVTDGE